LALETRVVELPLRVGAVPVVRRRAVELVIMFPTAIVDALGGRPGRLAEKVGEERL
jgi:hypothetical protein